MRRSGPRKGHATLELALSAGVMAAILAGAFQFGYSFYIYNKLLTAVGNGALYAAQRTYRSATPADVEKGAAAIRNMVVYGDSRPGPASEAVVPGLRPENVRVEWRTGAGGVPETVSVTVAAYTIQALIGDITLTGRPSAEFPYLGRYAAEESEP